jgi:O-antigen/teichoic acid export membrane protein
MSDNRVVRERLKVTARSKHGFAEHPSVQPSPPPHPDPGTKTPSVTSAHALRDVVVQIVGRLGNLLLGVLVTVTLARSLGVNGIGEWTTLMAISTITGYLVDPGLQTTAIRMVTADSRDEAGWLGALVALRAVTGILAAVSCFVISALVSNGEAMLVSAALISAVALTSPAQALGVVFQMRVRNERTIAFMTLNSLLWTGGVVAVAVLGGGLIAFSAILLLTSTFTALAQAIYVWRRTPVALGGVRRYAGHLLRVGIFLGIGSALTIAYGKIDQVLVLHYEGTDGAGLYGAAYSLLDKIQFLPVALMTTVFPIISAAWPSNPERARRGVQRALGYMTMMSLPALAFTLAAAEPLLVFLFGEQFAPAAGALRILVATFIPSCAGYVIASVALIVGRQRMLVLVALTGLIFNVVANLLLLPRYGYLAAAWITLATEIVVICPAAFISLRAMQARPDLRRLPRTAAAATIMGLTVWLAGRAGAGIVVLAFVAAIVYLLTLLATGALTPGDRDLLRRWVQRRAQ